MGRAGSEKWQEKGDGGWGQGTGTSQLCTWGKAPVHHGHMGAALASEVVRGGVL